MKNILYILFFITVSYKVTAQITYIPDPLFEQELIAQNIDSDGIVNGQILTSDIENITELYIEGSSMTDITGIQDFVSLEKLTITHTLITELTISNNFQLRYLFCEHNLLTDIDISNNIILEELYCGNNHDDVSPQNQITYIDLSNNPNIHTVFAENMYPLLNGGINLANGNNSNLIYLNVQRYGMDWIDETPICIQVDNAIGAINGELPYSEWIVIGGHFYSGENCVLGIQSFKNNKISIYPNPVSDMLYFEATDIIIEKVMVFDLSGRKILEQNQVNNLQVSDLQKGNYILKIVSDKGIQTEKIIVK